MKVLNRRTLLNAAAATTAYLFAGPPSRKAVAMEADPRIRVDVSVCFDSATMLWVPFRPPGAPAGLRLRHLRRLENGSLRSAIINAPAGWDSGGPLRLSSRLQVYITSGELRLGNRALKQNAYFNYAAGSVMPPFGSKSGAEFLLVCDAPPAFEPAAGNSETRDALVIEDVAAEFETRGKDPSRPRNMGGWTLWEDPESGATLSYLRVPPGWTSPGPEYHPCQEEILCLTGDIAPDDIRILKPGWFLWNPAYGVHGFHLHSTEGGTVLEWHDGPWDKFIYEGERAPA